MKALASINRKSLLNDYKFEKYFVLITFFLGLLSLGGIWSSISLFLPALRQQFNVGYLELALLFTVMLLPVPFTELIARPFKRYGQNSVVFMGFAMLAFFGTIYPFIDNFWLLLLARTIAASGFGLLFMYHTPVLAQYCHPSENTVNTLIMISGLVTGAFSSSYFSIYLYVFFNNSWQLTVAFWGLIAAVATAFWLFYMILSGKKEN